MVVWSTRLGNLLTREQTVSRYRLPYFIQLIWIFPCSFLAAMTVRGNEVIIHSALSFIRMFVSVRSTDVNGPVYFDCLICRIIVSLRTNAVTLMPNSCISCTSCSLTQRLHSGDWSMFLAAKHFCYLGLKLRLHDAFPTLIH